MQNNVIVIGHDGIVAKYQCQTDDRVLKCVALPSLDDVRSFGQYKCQYRTGMRGGHSVKRSDNRVWLAAREIRLFLGLGTNEFLDMQTYWL